VKGNKQTSTWSKRAKNTQRSRKEYLILFNRCIALHFLSLDHHQYINPRDKKKAAKDALEYICQSACTSRHVALFFFWTLDIFVFCSFGTFFLTTLIRSFNKGSTNAGSTSCVPQQKSYGPCRSQIN
jgi:hypothetical protein